MFPRRSDKSIRARLLELGAGHPRDIRYWRERCNDFLGEIMQWTYMGRSTNPTYAPMIAPRLTGRIRLNGKA